MKQIKVWFSYQFETIGVSGYCPLLKVGQSIWVKAKTSDGRNCKVLVEYSAANTDNFRIKDSPYDSYLCFRPYIRAAQYPNPFGEGK